MTAAALTAVLLLVGAGSARAAFVKEGSPYTVGDDPLSLNAGDFNGDGRPDVATINGSSSNVSVFLRQAGGGFAQEAGSPIWVGATRAERRGGRRLQRRRASDLAVSRFVGGRRVGAAAPVRRRLRDGGRRGVLARPGRDAVAAGDFNSDGRLDLAVTTSGGQVALLLRNPANTGFTVRAAFATGATPVAIAVGDYNGDGLADLAIANRDGDSVTLLPPVPAARSSPRRPSVGDDPVASSPPTSTATAAPISRSLTPPSTGSAPSCATRPTPASPRSRRSRSATRRSASPPPTSTATAGPTWPWPRMAAPSRSSAATPASVSRATRRSRSPAPSTTSRRPTSTATRCPTWRRRPPPAPRPTRSACC